MEARPRPRRDHAEGHLARPFTGGALALGRGLGLVHPLPVRSASASTVCVLRRRAIPSTRCSACGMGRTGWTLGSGADTVDRQAQQPARRARPRAHGAHVRTIPRWRRLGNPHLPCAHPRNRGLPVPTRPRIGGPRRGYGHVEPSRERTRRGHRPGRRQLRRRSAHRQPQQRRSSANKRQVIEALSHLKAVIVPRLLQPPATWTRRKLRFGVASRISIRRTRSSCEQIARAASYEGFRTAGAPRDRRTGRAR